MRKAWIAMSMILLVLFALPACGNRAADPAANGISIQEWLENKGGSDTSTMTVTVKTIENPVWAVIEDASGASVHLFGVMVDGEHKTFAEAGISEGDVIVISGGKYNEFEGTVEIAEAVLVEIKQSAA